MEALLKSALIRAPRRAETCILLLICAFGATTNAVAADATFVVDAGIGHTDNIGLTAIDQQSAVINTVGTLFSFTI